MKKFAAALLLCTCATGALAAGNTTEDKRFNRATANIEDVLPWEEKAEALPPYPASPDWIEVSVDDRNYLNRAYLNATDLTVGSDRVIRFSLRQLSPKGVENVSREGVLCGERQSNAYAFGDSVNQRWIPASRPAWKTIDPNDLLRRTIYRALCPDGALPADRDAAIAQLRKAG